MKQKKLVLIVVLIVLISCNRNQNKGPDTGVKIEICRMYGERDILLYTIKEKDILSVDWENQSYMIKKNTIDSINKIITPGLGAEYLKYYYNEQLIYSINIPNIASSNRHIDEKMPSIVVFDNWIISKDGWLVICPIDDRNGNVYSVLRNQQVFEHLRRKKLLSSNNWEKKEDYMCDNFFAINENFSVDFCSKFKTELWNCDFSLNVIFSQFKHRH